MQRPTIHQRLRRPIVWAAALLVTVAALVGLRVPILRAAGWALVAEDPMEPAEVIVVPEWAQNAGALEASDLVHRGIAASVAVIVKPEDPSTRELVRRGILRADASVWPVQLLTQLRVQTVDLIPAVGGGTEAEGGALPSWCNQHHVGSIIVVTTLDHSRRVRRILRRSMRGQHTKVIVRSTRYASFDPDRWWETRDGVRTEAIELEKLLLDVVRHPIS